MALIELRKVSKGYSRAHSGWRYCATSIWRSRMVSSSRMVGFSGSGKTTLISILAGLVAPDAGQVLFKGQPVTGAAPERAVVFQNYSLLPWLSVTGNVALAVGCGACGLELGPAAAHRSKNTSTWLAFRTQRIAGRQNSPAGCASGSPWHGPWPSSRNPADGRAAVGSRRTDSCQAPGRDRGDLGTRATHGGPGHERRRRGPVACRSRHRR